MNKEFEDWHRRTFGHFQRDGEHFKWMKVAFESGQSAEREACALEAQSFQIAHCKSHHDDSVDKTAYAIKEAIINRDHI